MTGQQNEFIIEWSMKLAEQVAPDEVLLAPIVANAFMEGGERRRQVLSTSNSVMGGFGPGSMMAVMPAVLDTIAATAPLLMATLSSSLVGSFLGTIDNTLELMALSRHHRAARNANKPSVESGSAIPDNTVAPLLQAIEAMKRELQSKGVSGELCEAAAYRSLKVLLMEPDEAKVFVQDIAKGETR